MIFPDLKKNIMYVDADRIRVKQVMINLLSNSIKYNRNGGKVTVQCSMSSQHYVRVTIQDTGSGLAPEQLAHLFEPFNRLGKETSTEEGTGIGLVVTKQLIELMGGNIGVESILGEGSLFWIELPASNKLMLAKNTSREIDLSIYYHPEIHNSFSGNTLLYIEDDPANLTLIEQLVARRSDLKFLKATDGLLGIQAAITSLPDIILMDINLPYINGFTALKILRENPKTAHIPVIALSANALPREVEKGIEAGFHRYLVKPIEVSDFMNSLDTAMKQVLERSYN